MLARASYKFRHFVKLLSLTLLTLLLFTAPSLPFDTVKHFKGKTVTLVVGYAPGGGYDTWARLFAEFAPKHVPGNPKFVVQNQPGAGSLLAVQNVMRAKPDGLTMVVFPNALIIRELLGEDLQGFDHQKALYLGKPDAVRDAQAYYLRTVVAGSWEQAKALGRPVTNGETEIGSQVGIAVAWVEIVGGPIKNVYGYGGTSEIMAAVDRGELDGTTRGDANTVLKLFPEWVAKKYLTPILKWRGPMPEDWLSRNGWKQPPDVFDVIKASVNQKEALTTALDLTVGSKVFALPPDAPNEIYVALKKAFEDTVKDPDFNAAATKRRYDVGFQSADDFMAINRRALQASPDIKALLKKLFTGK